MLIKSKTLEERRLIVSDRQRRKYGVKLRILTSMNSFFGFGGSSSVDNVSIPLNTGAFVTIEQTSNAPLEAGLKYLLTMDGFKTATDADKQARRLVQALLWTGISTDQAIKLDYLGHEPFTIYDRNISGGTTCQAYGEVSYRPQLVLGEIYGAFAELEVASPSLLLSMEIFASVGLESSLRTKFLAQVSALEPLVQPAMLGPEVGLLIDRCLAQLQESVLPDDRKHSLRGRIDGLRKESIRQAIRRVVRETLPDWPEAVRIADRAYELRSEIVHTGRTDPDLNLHDEGLAISRVVRRLYASMLKRELVK